MGKERWLDSPFGDQVKVCSEMVLYDDMVTSYKLIRVRDRRGVPYGYSGVFMVSQEFSRQDKELVSE